MPRVAYKPLSEAVYKRDAKLLASLAADDPAAAQHWKPITDAAFVGSVDCVNVLVEHGADVNVKSGTGSKHTPLTRLCQYHTTIPKHDGHKETLDRLLEVGADPMVAAGPLGLTPLCYAAMGPLEDLVASLIGEVRPLDVFSAALLYDMRRLKQHAKKNGLATVDQEQRTPLHYVALSGMFKVNGTAKAIECVDFILDQGVDVNAMQPIAEGNGVFNANALWYGVSWQSNVELTRHLLAKGADPNPGVFAALWGGVQEICEMLDSHGADWNQQEGGSTPLMDMIRYKRIKLLPWLMERDIDLAIKDNDGMTALDLAYKRKVRKELVDLLIEKGANTGVN